ncbi:Nin1 binding protein [Serendipita sp. 411]|nr:Nin1 binding protein [Serendipita sp. 411]
MDTITPRVESLVLDAGPLLSLSPLKGLSKSYFTVPQVLGELKDDKSREHFQNLGLLAGVKVETRMPDSTALAQVTLAAKKTGDYTVLSVADLNVLALTYALHQEYSRKNSPESALLPKVSNEQQEQSPPDLDPVAINTQTAEHSDPELNDLKAPDEDVDQIAEEFERLPLDEKPKTSLVEAPYQEEGPLYDDPEEEDDDQGEWITPSNVALHKSRALDLLPDRASKHQKRKETGPIGVGCMTADYAMQNVLLHMGLNLVGVDGTRISNVKSWVLRCHACFKICKDPSKKFCPSCGNPSLLRTSISTTAPKTPGGTPKVQIHLKSNFQYRTRGTKYSIPMPKPGNSKTGSGTGMILREDQQEYMKAMEKEARREERDHQKLMKALLKDDNPNPGSVKVGDWDDPDWMPDMLIGTGKRKDSHGGMPVIGAGRKNPNERRRKR